MTEYHTKLLELKAIKKVSDKIFLQVRLSFKEDLDILLEIDEFTSEHISALIEDDEKYKYRLSFNNYFDAARQEHVGTLARTYLDSSDNIPFSCSEEYVNILASIKDIEDVSDLDKLSFISGNLETFDVKQEEQELSIEIESKSYTNKSPGLILFSFSTVFILFFGYLTFISSDEAIISRGALAESIELYNEVVIEEDEPSNIKDDILADALAPLEDAFLAQSNVKSIELDELITYSIPKGNVAITFDDGPSKYTKEIADVLKKYEVGGTFFFVGKNVKKLPDNVKYVLADGFSIGSHSINHYDLPKISSANRKYELIQSIELLKEITDTEITLFRPPYGSYNEDLKSLIYENNYKMVLWDNDPKDWKTRNSDRIFNDIKNSDVSGSIILLHESQAVIDALPKIIEYLQQLDLEIVNLK